MSQLKRSQHVDADQILPDALEHQIGKLVRYVRVELCKCHPGPGTWVVEWLPHTQTRSTEV